MVSTWLTTYYAYQKPLNGTRVLLSQCSYASHCQVFLWVKLTLLRLTEVFFYLYIILQTIWLLAAQWLQARLATAWGCALRPVDAAGDWPAMP